jgi:hypothetical protein
VTTSDKAIGPDPTPTETPPLSSLVDWHVGKTEGGPYYVEIALTNADEARAWAAWLLALPSENQD